AGAPEPPRPPHHRARPGAVTRLVPEPTPRGPEERSATARAIPHRPGGRTPGCRARVRAPDRRRRSGPPSLGTSWPSRRQPTGPLPSVGVGGDEPPRGALADERVGQAVPPPRLRRGEPGGVEVAGIDPSHNGPTGSDSQRAEARVRRLRCGSETQPVAQSY